MSGDGAAEPKYGDREYETRHSSEDEEAQLLETEDFEQFEIEEENRTPARRCCSLLYGPHPPRPQSIRPLFPFIQESPIRLLDRWAPKRWQRVTLLVVYLIVWAIAFAAPLRKGKGAVTDDLGRTVRQLNCVDTLWRRNNECGLDGIDCRPFSNESFAFRCPANCAGVKLLNPHHVGLQDVNYRPLVVGGPVYRGDSFLCGSAIHSGVVDDATGGCGVVNLVGSYYEFYSSEQNGIESISFDSYFPLSFSVAKDSHIQCESKDPRAPMFILSLLFTAGLSLFTTSPAVTFFVSFVSIYLHVALVSDPLNVSGPSATVLPRLFSWFLGTFLPAMFCAAVLYFTCVRRSLQNLTAQFEKTLLWLGGFWFGALSNYTFDWIPLSRLTSHDLEQQPGAKLALAGVVVVLVLIVAQQAYFFWVEGRLPRYLALYGLFIVAILLALAMPGLKLRIHHYVLALLLLPGTSMQTRPALLYQGLLLGLFVNGVARWGFAPVLETAAALRGDGEFGSLLPVFVEPLIYLDTSTPNISFKWKESPGIWSYDGISILVNDVERYRGFFAEVAPMEQTFTWTREPTLKTHEYFRFGYVKDGIALDYTEAAIWFANGTWSRGAAFYR
ncbi:hypothetical protein GQ53DRAFT_783706 [Thozetella sp. PMI_491]|nr:hypothetical protein GQ53DRAFT_783706 [Thozetella sp. PMI_491]